MNDNDATDDVPLDPDATEVVTMDLEAMLHMELDAQRSKAPRPKAPRTMPLLKAAPARSFPRMPIHTLPPPAPESGLDDDECPTSFYDRKSVRPSVASIPSRPSVKSVTFPVGSYSAPRTPLPFNIAAPHTQKLYAGESMGITPIQPILPPTSRRDLQAPSALESLAPMSMGSAYPSYAPAAPKSNASTLALVLTLTFAIASVVLMGIAVTKPDAIDKGRTTVSSLFSKSKKGQPTAPAQPIAVAAAHADPPPHATIAVPPVLFEEGVIEEVGDTESIVVFPESSKGHRLFIDGRAVGEGNDRGMLVACGKHKVQLGSNGTARVMDLPCGGGVRLTE